ncbi:hypothetical protein [Synechococcus sp. 1G10]|uniref:hypothetical protein n=1 Tax=Synechococcus sp. 1G10 TaxID=2025605 RepID=UPI001E51DDF4|nr:hypothetical protein [Synechococcus sp. 1G10]
MVVLRLRAGDVADLAKSDYPTNPRCYYEQLSRVFRSLPIVTEPGPTHDLFAAIAKLFDSHRIVSGDFPDDFHLLANFLILAASGVGSSPIAVAFVLRQLKPLYASTLFLREHLTHCIL